MQIDISAYRHIVVLTGAGVSAASGLPTYRGPGGLWKDEDVARLNTAEAFAQSPMEVWQLFGGLRQRVRNAAPNAAHEALATMEKNAPGEFLLVTQNVDGLHQRAGSEKVVELHGNLHRTRCSNPECELEPFEDAGAPSEPPRCELCDSFLRPGIVLFGEPMPASAEHLSKRALRDCDLFIAVGTSGTVSPASNFVRSAEYVGARTLLINLERLEGTRFQEQLLGKAEEILPRLV